MNYSDFLKIPDPDTNNDPLINNQLVGGTNNTPLVPMSPSSSSIMQQYGSQAIQTQPWQQMSQQEPRASIPDTTQPQRRSIFDYAGETVSAPLMPKGITVPDLQPRPLGSIKYEDGTIGLPSIPGKGLLFPREGMSEQELYRIQQDVGGLPSQQPQMLTLNDLRGMTPQETMRVPLDRMSDEFGRASLAQRQSDISDTRQRIATVQASRASRENIKTLERMGLNEQQIRDRYEQAYGSTIDADQKKNPEAVERNLMKLAKSQLATRSLERRERRALESLERDARFDTNEAGQMVPMNKAARLVQLNDQMNMPSADPESDKVLGDYLTPSQKRQARRALESRDSTQIDRMNRNLQKAQAQMKREETTLAFNRAKKQVEDKRQEMADTVARAENDAQVKAKTAAEKQALANVKAVYDLAAKETETAVKEIERLNEIEDDDSKITYRGTLMTLGEAKQLAGQKVNDLIVEQEKAAQEYESTLNGAAVVQPVAAPATAIQGAGAIPEEALLANEEAIASGLGQFWYNGKPYNVMPEWVRK